MIQPQRRLFLLIAAGFVLCSYGLMWGLPNLFDFAQDSVIPYGNLAQRGFSFEQITSYRYPPFHFWVLRAVFAPVRGLIAGPDAEANLKVNATYFILAARLVSIAMALGTVGLIYATGKRLWDESTGLAAGLVFILSPVTLYYAKNANLDIPYLFWLAATLFFYVRILREDRERDYLWLGLAAALAVCTKDQAYGFILLMPLPILYKLFKGEKPSGDARRSARLGLAAAGFLIPFLLIHNILFNPNGFWLHVKTIIGPGSDPWQELTTGVVGQLRLLAETLLHVTGAWTPAAVALVVIGLVAEFRSREGRRNWVLLLPALSYYASFLAIVHYVYPRFVLPIMLVLSLFAGRGVMWLWTRKCERPLLPRIAAAALVVWIAIAGLSLDFVMSNYCRYDAQKWLEKNVPAGATMGYMGDMRDMPRFNKPLDPHQCEANEDALAQAAPNVLVLSFQQGHPATGARCMRPASMALRNLGSWGRLRSRAGPRARGFFEKLVDGELGYDEIKRFESPIGPIVPQVAESANRTIVVMKRR